MATSYHDGMQVNVKEIIREEFINNIKPLEIVPYFQNIDRELLSQNDVERIRQVTRRSGNPEGARELLERLSKADWWFQRLKNILRHPDVDLGDLANKLEYLEEAVNHNPQDDVVKKISRIFVDYVDPSNVLHVFHSYNMRVLTQRDIERVRAVTYSSGKYEGASELLSRLQRYSGWLPCLLQVLRDRDVKLSHVAQAMEDLFKEPSEDAARYSRNQAGASAEQTPKPTERAETPRSQSSDEETYSVVTTIGMPSLGTWNFRKPITTDALNGMISRYMSSPESKTAPRSQRFDEETSVNVFETPNPRTSHARPGVPDNRYPNKKIIGNKSSSGSNPAPREQTSKREDTSGHYRERKDNNKKHEQPVTTTSGYTATTGYATDTVTASDVSEPSVSTATHNENRISRNRSSFGSTTAPIGPVSDASAGTDVVDALEPGLPIIDPMDIQLTQNSAVGFGAYGIVNLANWKGKGNDLVIIKQFRKADRQFKREVKQLSRVCHRNIVKVFGVYYNEPKIVQDLLPAGLVMEYAKDQSLMHVIHESEELYTRADAINWIRQCALGVEHLHSRTPCVLHRDLKPSNLLLFENRKVLKLCDFGLARDIKTTMTKYRGTSTYMAPELTRGEKHYNQNCDVYSFGIIFWETLKRQSPTMDQRPDMFLMADLSLMGKGSIENLPKQLEELMISCLSSTPSDRPAMTVIVEEMSTAEQLFKDGSLQMKMEKPRSRPSSDDEENM